MQDTFDFVTNVASVGYLTHPREVFSEMHRVLKPGGVAIIGFSNRCFESKATRLWLGKMDEETALCGIVRNCARARETRVLSAEFSGVIKGTRFTWVVTCQKALWRTVFGAGVVGEVRCVIAL
jgi:SAM-dependent methyltransferase